MSSYHERLSVTRYPHVSPTKYSEPGSDRLNRWSHVNMSPSAVPQAIEIGYLAVRSTLDIGIACIRRDLRHRCSCGSFRSDLTHHSNNLLKTFSARRYTHKLTDRVAPRKPAPKSSLDWLCRTASARSASPDRLRQTGFVRPERRPLTRSPPSANRQPANPSRRSNAFHPPFRTCVCEFY